MQANQCCGLFTLLAHGFCGATAALQDLVPILSFTMTAMSSLFCHPSWKILQELI
jgi:hypothetical protein